MYTILLLNNTYNHTFLCFPLLLPLSLVMFSKRYLPLLQIINVFLFFSAVGVFDGIR